MVCCMYALHALTVLETNIRVLFFCFPPPFTVFIIVATWIMLMICTSLLSFHTWIIMSPGTLTALISSG